MRRIETTVLFPACPFTIVNICARPPSTLPTRQIRPVMRLSRSRHTWPRFTSIPSFVTLSISCLLGGDHRRELVPRAVNPTKASAAFKLCFLAARVTEYQRAIASEDVAPAVERLGAE